MSKDKTKRPPYRKQATARPPITFEVGVRDGAGDLMHLDVTAKHVDFFEFDGLNGLLAGEFEPVADVTGAVELKCRRIKVKAVVLEIANLDPDEFPGGSVAGKDLAAFIDDDHNVNAVYVIWGRFVEVIDNPRRKSAAANRGQGDGEGEAGGERGAAGSPVPAVSRADGTAAPQGQAVQAGAD
jgi:hypothetical protein